ncbi:hypothetical protein CPB86DRAFT_820336 [Serendipita vermifera]|nr:hypothetical protein CPB86DRAFT_820336 [Serendipita vermifera]
MFELVLHSPNPPYGLIPMTKALKYILIYQILRMEMGVLCQDNVMFIWLMSTPSTRSKLSNMDQAMALVTHIRLSWRPKECTTIESASGFYGPGTYWAWILTTLSAMLNTMLPYQNKAISLDLIGSSLYALTSMADFQLQVCLECKHQSDFQAKASLQIVAVSDLLCLLAPFLV